MAKQFMNAKESKRVKQEQRSTISLPPEKAFYFWAGDRFLGIRASNLQEFKAILESVDPESIRFHLQRKDFQKWLINELQEAKLAQSLDRVKLEQDLSKMRAEILGLVKDRL